MQGRNVFEGANKLDIVAGINISGIDLGIIIAYLVGIVGVGCWSGLKSRKGAEGKDYFLAGGTLKWHVIGLALFSTNISTVHLVSLAEEGYRNGLAYGNFEWMAAFTLIILALFFVPFYIRSRVATLPDFLEKRFSKACRNWLAGISIVSAIFIHIGFSLYAGAVVLNGLFGFDVMTSIVVIALLTGLYTIVGGLQAVVLTESIQTIILLFGAICLTMIGYNEIGGWDGLSNAVEPVKLTVMRPKGDPSGLPWYSVLLGYPIIGIWYWCTDQTIVQRVLGAKDENHAKAGALFAGFIKILPMFIFVLPGLICFALIDSGKLDNHDMRNMPVAETVMLDGKEIPVTEGRIPLSGETVKLKSHTVDITGMTDVYIENRLIDESDPEKIQRVLVIDGKDQKDSADTYAFMITKLLPRGLTGLMAAALLAALMSTVSGALNSIATLFSFDLYKQFKPETSNRKLVLVGRIVTFVGMLLAIAWSPLVAKFDTIFSGIITAICYLAPPITVVFVAGVFWKRATSQAAFMTFVVGSSLGFVVFLLDFFKEQTGWSILSMMASFYLAVICAGVLVVVSLVKPVALSEEKAKLVWTNPLDCLKAPGWRGIGDYRVLSVLLFVVMIVLYAVFG